MTEIIKVIDTDVHNAVRDDRDLVPYLKDPWRKRVEESGWGILWNGYYSPVGFARKDAIPPDGAPPASDPAFLKKQLMDRCGVEFAILTGEKIWNISATPDPDFAAALVSAYNDWLIEEWLERDDVFRGAMVIATQDPLQAAKEIDRIGGHPRIVEVLMGSATRIPFGDRYFHPIYEAAERNGLPIAIHPGNEGTGIAGPPTAAGYPSLYIEYHTSLSQNFMANLISVVCQGVFEKFPGLKFVLLEGGVSWLPHVMWRLDKNYKALRALVPWLKRMPSEYIRDHCFLSTQPVEEPENEKQLLAIFEMIDAENILMFSSDYPHWDFDDPLHILRKLPKHMKQKIYSGNARQLYRLP